VSGPRTNLHLAVIEALTPLFFLKQRDASISKGTWQVLYTFKHIENIIEIQSDTKEMLRLDLFLSDSKRRVVYNQSSQRFPFVIPALLQL
jgi:hypothetical protein